MAFGDDIIVRMGLDNRPFSKGLRKSTAMAQKFGSILTVIGGAAATGFLKGSIDKAREFADTITTLSASTDISTKAIQEFRFVAEQMGSSTELADSALERFNKRIGEAANGTGRARDAIARLGISLRDQNGSLKGNEEILREVIKRINTLDAASEKAAATSDIFGREAIELVNVLKLGIDEFDNLAKGASIASDDALNAIDRLDKRIKDFSQSLDTSKITIIGGFLEMLDVIRQFQKQSLEFGAAPAVPSLFTLGGLGPLALLFGQDKRREKPEQVLKAFGKSFTKLMKDVRTEEEAATKAAKERADAEDKVKEKIKEQSAALRKQRSELRSKKEDRAKFTLEELATSPVRFTGRLGFEQQQAREAFLRERLGERLRQRGFVDPAIQQFERADQIRGSLINLTAAERFPFRSMEQGIRETSQNIAELRRQAQQEGLRVIPSNG